MHLRSMASMKTAWIPKVRVDPGLRARLEAVLLVGESLSQFVEDAVRQAVERRSVQNRFHADGEARWQECQQTGRSPSADDVIAALRQKVEDKRMTLGS